MSEYKAGLHKEVSAIFNGVSLSKNDIAQQSLCAPAPGHQNYGAPKPPAPESPALEPPSQRPPALEPPSQRPPAPEPPVQKPRAPSHMTPTKPKPPQPPSQPQKEATGKQPKAKTGIKAAGKPQWQRTLEQIQNKLFASKPGVNTTKQKAMVVMIPVLCIVMIFVFIRVFNTPSGKITGPGKPGPVKANAAASNKKVEWKIPEAYPATLRDPMQFGPATNESGEGDGAGIILKGIVYSKNNPCAVIGDQIVHQGDKILDVIITKINENSVEFEANGKKWTQKVQR